MVYRITASELTPVPVHLGVLFMGDKSPKATSKQAAQKQGRRRKLEEKRRCQRQAAVRYVAFQKVAHSQDFLLGVQTISLY